jgi:hypothetical protein
MHLHLGFMHGFTVFLYVLVFMGVMKLLALRFQGHPLSEAILEVY